jgi:hypothetical protein
MRGRILRRHVTNNMYSIALIVSLVVLGPTGCQSNKGPVNHSQSVNSPPVRSDTTGQSQTDSDVIRSLIESLSSNEPTVRTHSERELINLAKSSAELRGQVIQELMKSVESKDELDGHHFVLEDTFLFWSSATLVFADIKAVEAIDVMIRCIDSSNGLSGNMGEPPSAYGLVRMGPVAIPKLAQALRNEPNRTHRARIVLSLGRIGGPQARAVLRRALKTETDKGVRYYINWALHPSMH